MRLRRKEETTDDDAAPNSRLKRIRSEFSPVERPLNDLAPVENDRAGLHDPGLNAGPG